MTVYSCSSTQSSNRIRRNQAVRGAGYVSMLLHAAPRRGSRYHGLYDTNDRVRSMDCSAHLAFRNAARNHLAEDFVEDSLKLREKRGRVAARGARASRGFFLRFRSSSTSNRINHVEAEDLVGARQRLVGAREYRDQLCVVLSRSWSSER